MCLSQPITPLPFLIIPEHNHTINLISPNPEFLVEPTWCPFWDIQQYCPNKPSPWHCVDAIITKEFQIWVLHVPGEHNVITNAISWWEFYQAQQLAPGLQINTFQVPTPTSLHTEGNQKMIVLHIHAQQLIQEPWSWEQLVHKQAIALGQAIDVSTWNNYSSALNSYLTFIWLHNIPVEPTHPWSSGVPWWY